MTPIKVRSAIVPIGSVKPYPLNPRRGNVNVIEESLKINGQFRPIVVQQETNFILAGNHTWRAAKNLGWSEIAVSFISCDEKTAKKILLADNRLSDLGSFQDGALMELLQELESWQGTGYDLKEFDEIDGLYQEPLPTPKAEEDPEKPQVAPTVDETEHFVRIGFYIMDVEEEDLNKLAIEVKQRASNKKEQVEVLKEMLGLVSLETKDKELITHQVVMGETEVVPIESITSHPRNPREGDVGAISESLRVFGQYRPIVVDKNTNFILVGNHTWQAALALGWETIAVTWVDVDEEQAIRILLVDNKSADLARYEDEELQMLLSSLNEFSGTGFDGDDIDSILRGADTTPLPKSVKAIIGNWKFKVSRKEFEVWQDSLPLDMEEACGVIASRLNLNSWTVRKVEE